MPRSLKVKQEYISRVKSALKRNGFPSQKAFASEMGLSRPTVSSFLNGRGIDYLNFVDICEKLGLNWQEMVVDESEEEVIPVVGESEEEAISITRVDWGDAPDMPVFYGRENEIEQLEKWILEERCRLVGLSGMEGMGTTSLAIKLAQRIQNQFEYVIWRSLQHSPLMTEILEDLIKFISEQQETELNKTIDQKISFLISLLKVKRCLIILDDIAAITGECNETECKIENIEIYRKLIEKLGTTNHQSCLTLISRSGLPLLSHLKSRGQSVRILSLEGLKTEEIKLIAISEKIGAFKASEQEWRELVEKYNGNPWLLKITANNIQEFFQGNISKFIQNGNFAINGIKEFIENQIRLLSDIEKDIIYWLAINRYPVDIFELKRVFLPHVTESKLLECLKGLKRRSLIVSSGEGIFTLQPFIMDYMTERLVEQVCEEIENCRPLILNFYPLVIAITKEYVIEKQIKFILEPIKYKLLSLFTIKKQVIEKLNEILLNTQNNPNQVSRYFIGNILNVLINLKADLKDFNFSNLTIRQALLQDTELRNINFTNAHLYNSVFLEAFSNVLSIALSPDGKHLAIGDTDGQIYLWDLTNGRPSLVRTYKGHIRWVRAIAFSPDGKMIASGSEDQTIRLWDVETEKCLQIFDGHLSRIRAVTFSPNGKFLASGSDDCTVKFWDVIRNDLRATLTKHRDKVRAVIFSSDSKVLVSASQDCIVHLWDVNTCQSQQIIELKEHGGNLLRAIALSPDNQFFASGCDDTTVRLWNLSTGKCLQTFEGHTDWIRSVIFSPEGKFLASSSEDETVRIWHLDTGECFQTLKGHRGSIWSIAFDPEGQILVSGSDDQSVRFWDISTGQSLRTLQGYNREVRPITFSPDGQTLASGTNEHTIKFWEVSTGQYLKSLVGHSGRVWSVAISPGGKWLASASDDRTLRLWEISTGKCLRIFKGHTNWIRTVTFNPNGQIIASGSDDKTIRLWNVATGECIQILSKHTDWIRSVAFSADGKILASGSDDRTIILWKFQHSKYHYLNFLSGHSHQVWSIAFSPKNNVLASGSNDNTIKLWNIETRECWLNLNEHKDWVQSVAFNPDGKILASGSHDQTVRLWDLASGECLKILQGHGKEVVSVTFSPDGLILASGSRDGTVKLWNVKTGDCLNTLRSPLPYEGMNITGVGGLNEAQKKSLKALGAVENN